MAVPVGLWIGGVVAAAVAVVTEGLYESGLRRARQAGKRLGRPWAFRLALVVFVAAFSWPLAELAHTYVFAEAVQASLLGYGIPALVAVGGPWAAFDAWLPARQRRKRPARKVAPTRPAVRVGGPGALRPPKAVVDGKGRLWARPLVFVAVVILWRLPVTVDALHNFPPLVVLEVASLMPAGIVLWRQLVASGSHSPRADRALRIGLAAVAMWGTWIAAYALGFFQHAVFAPYASAPGRALGPVTDQELSAGVMFVAAAGAFVPIVFLNLFRWLRSQDDLDEALYSALREESQRFSSPEPDFDPHNRGEAGGA